MSNAALPPRRDLYRWQLDALVAWLRCGRRGVVEAVTGSGKTDLAIAAAIDARRRGLFVLVVVPSRVLIEQWHARLRDAMPPGTRIGRLGDGSVDEPAGCDVLVATRHSAAAYKPLPGPEGGLIIVDECHGLGGSVLRKALLGPYEERLGLTATLERSDNLVADLLLPFFGGVCFRYGFGDAIADGVCAQPRVAFVGVALSAEERAEYVATEQRLVESRAHLRRVRGMPLEPFGLFLAAVGHLADHDSGADGRAARDYLDAFGKRRQIVAQSSGKYELLGRFAGLIRGAQGALLFTETVRAANHAINRLDPFVAIDLITGSTARRSRQDILTDLRFGRLDAVAAPRVLDEGIDVPDANLGIVVSASRTRRQMVQRMGRILRRKRLGVGARFVIMFARDTIEDPSVRVERDGFLEEIEAISESSGIFHADHFEEIEAFLDYAGPAASSEPLRLGPYRHVATTEAEAPTAAGTDVTGAGEPVTTAVAGDQTRALRRGDADAWGAVAASAGIATAVDLIDALGYERVYAQLSMVTWDAAGPLHRAVWARDAQITVHPGDYLALEEVELPLIKTPKVAPKRLSTGDRPLALTAAEGGWAMRCTGCGQVSNIVRFRWQAFEETVGCECA